MDPKNKVIGSPFDYILNSVKKCESKTDFVCGLFNRSIWLPNFFSRSYFALACNLAFNYKDDVHLPVSVTLKEEGEFISIDDFMGGKVMSSDIFIKHRLDENLAAHASYKDVKTYILISESFLYPAIGFGDSVQDSYMLFSTGLPIAVNPDPLLVSHVEYDFESSEDRNWIIFKEGDDAQSLISKINEHAIKKHSVDVYKLLGIKPPALLDIDGTFFKGLLLQIVVDDLSKEGIFDARLSEHLQRILRDRTASYEYKGVSALEIYAELKSKCGLSDAEAYAKIKGCLHNVKHRFYDYTINLLSGIQNKYQPIIVSAEPFEISEALCEMEFGDVKPFANCLIMDLFPQSMTISADLYNIAKRYIGFDKTRLESLQESSLEVLLHRKPLSQSNSMLR